MPVVGGKVFTASLAGRRTQAVTCEKCGQPYRYELTRVGIGKGSAVYGIGQGGASRRAGAAAQSNLGTRLDEDADLVPCPACHWVNQDLVDRYRRRQYLRVKLPIVLIFVVGFFGAIFLAAGLSATLGYNSRVPGLVMPAMTVLCVLLAAGVLFGRRQLRLQIDPNATYPRPPTVPPGTPPALVERRDPRTKAVVLVAVPSSSPELRHGNLEWAVFRPGQVRWPAVCCMCLAPATTGYRSPLKVDGASEVTVPLCGACQSSLRRRWWLTVGGVGAISAVVGTLAWAIPVGDAVGRWILFGLVVFFGTLVGGVVTASRTCKPYRMTMMDRERGIVKFAASHPGFTSLLVEQIRASDGAAG